MAFFIISDIVGTVIKAGQRAVSYNIAVKPAEDLLIIFNIPVDDKRTVFRKQLGELMERVTDILQIFKEVKMIFFNI